MTNQKLKAAEAVEKWEEFFEKQKEQLNSISSSSGKLKVIDLVKYPVITEKTYVNLYKNRQYTFDVDKRLTKPQIKKLFEKLFNVNIVSVNTHIPPRRRLRVGMAQGYKPTFKRAILTLKEGQSITF